MHQDRIIRKINLGVVAYITGTYLNKRATVLRLGTYGTNINFVSYGTRLNMGAFFRGKEIWRSPDIIRWKND